VGSRAVVIYVQFRFLAVAAVDTMRRRFERLQ